MNRTTTVTVTLLSAALVACFGCSSVQTGDWKLAKTLDVRRAMWWKEHKPEPQIPVRLVSTWTDTVLHRPGQKSQRGFGGRLSFFGRESEDPVRVDGQLVVYAYDESSGDPRSAQPTRRYIFPREQFARHESESQLGPSYSVWLPWDDEVGSQRKNVSLIARFEPHEGPLLVGEQTRHLLPGTALAGDTPAVETASGTVQLAQHTTTSGTESETNVTSADGSARLRPEMTTKSIHLSEHWRERIASQSTTGGFRERYSTAATEPTAVQPAVIPRELFPPRTTEQPPRSDRPSAGFPHSSHPAAAQSSSR